MKGLYQHFTGDIYEVLMVGQCVNTGAPLVIYRDKDGGIFVEPEHMFSGYVKHNGATMPKFTRLENNFIM